MFQRTGSFKMRGASNKLLSLPRERLAGGVLTHSSGNHGAALALAARECGVRAHVVMPENSSAIKVAAVRGYGGDVTFCRATVSDRAATAERVRLETGAVMVHPYDDPAIVCGQGTAALELLEAVPDLDLILAPIGGGGLMAGTAIAAKGLCPGIRVLGAEPALADDARRSLEARRRIPLERTTTIADGLRTSLGEVTFPILLDHVERILTADEAGIIAAMRLLWERLKVVAEPSAAVPLAALLRGVEGLEGRRIGVILSGGNVDLDRLPFGDAASPR